MAMRAVNARDTVLRPADRATAAFEGARQYLDRARVQPRANTRGTIHVVDDDAASRRAIGEILGAAGHDPRLYASAAAYLEARDSDGPSCLVVVLPMPGLDGLGLQAALLARGYAHPVLFVSAHGDVASAVRAMRNGALDFLTKPVPARVLLDAVDNALHVDIERRARHVHVAALTERYAALTPREREVMAGVIAGRLNKQISFELHAAERTVKTHRSRVMRKMGVRSVAQLVRLAEDLRTAGVNLGPTPE